VDAPNPQDALDAVAPHMPKLGDRIELRNKRVRVSAFTASPLGFGKYNVSVQYEPIYDRDAFRADMRKRWAAF
jgi:hypothetical protein